MRTLKNFLSITLVGVFFAIGAISMAGAADYNMKMSTYLSPNMSWAFKDMAKEIEQASGGRIKITLFAGGELVSSNDALKAVKTGVLQMVHGSGYHFDELKEAPVEAGLPMTWGNAVEAQTLWDQMGFNELVAKAYDQAGVHYIGPIWIAPYAITSKKPVKNLDDLKNMKIRASTGPAKMFNKLGISTVYMKPEEMYLALSTGQIDGVLYGGAAEYKELSFPEVCPYYTSTFVVNPLVDNLLINKKFWNKLPSDLKAIIESAAYKARWHYYNWVMSQEYSIQSEYYKGKVTALDADAVAQMTKAAKVVWKEESAKSPLAKEMMDKIEMLLKGLGRLQ